MHILVSEHEHSNNRTHLITFESKYQGLYA